MMRKPYGLQFLRGQVGKAYPSAHRDAPAYHSGLNCYLERYPSKNASRRTLVGVRLFA